MAVAPAMSLQLVPASLPRCHWYVKVIGWVPAHVPGPAVSVWPCSAVPVTVGAAVLVGTSTSTATVTTPVSLPPLPSSTVYGNVAAPLKPAVDVYITWSDESVTVPLLAGPTAVTVRAPPSMSVSFEVRSEAGKLIGTPAMADLLSSTATGASLTGVTVTETVPVSVLVPSETV